MGKVSLALRCAGRSRIRPYRDHEPPSALRVERSPDGQGGEHRTTPSPPVGSPNPPVRASRRAGVGTATHADSVRRLLCRARAKARLPAGHAGPAARPGRTALLRDRDAAGPGRIALPVTEVAVGRRRRRAASKSRSWQPVGRAPRLPLRVRRARGLRRVSRRGALPTGRRRESLRDSPRHLSRGGGHPLPAPLPGRRFAPTGAARTLSTACQTGSLGPVRVRRRRRQVADGRQAGEGLGGAHRVQHGAGDGFGGE